jgi:hypothetical protein
VNAGADSPSRQRWERVYSLAMHKDTFNADFYLAAATVIPILYLALTLQGQPTKLSSAAHLRILVPSGRFLDESYLGDDTYGNVGGTFFFPLA